MNTETRARGVHSSRPGGYTHNDAHAACATIKGFEVMRALRKGQAGIFALQGGIVGEARVVERAFGLGPCAPAEVRALLQDRLANAES